MKLRLVILTEIISPYRIPLFNALAREENIDLHVIFLAETDPNLRQWRIYKEEIRFSHSVLPSWRKRLGGYNLLLNRGLRKALATAAPEAILCGGYNYLASWQALLWAEHHHIPFLLWSESNIQDLRRGYLMVEFLKREFLRRCNGFVVPGQSAREFLRGHKIGDGSIFTAPNAVDNEMFALEAARAREDPDCRRKLNLPARYFLFAGRLVREKGVFDLLSAYAKLNAGLREQVGLVFAGDGESRTQLEEQATAISPGVIRFGGFAHREVLAAYYALAEALVLPTYSDPWGLVVNEAMACGLPVILSEVAGCAADLVKERWNGLLVAPGDIPALTAAMETMAQQPELRAAMSANAKEHIVNYSAQTWSEGIVRAAVGNGNVHE
jgi:glycosyltransferase involved in cell wall biosynthesis